MKKYLNTLFVTTQDSYLSKQGETIVVSVEKETRLQLPIHTISGIVCFGRVSISPFLMGFCAENSVAISFITEYGNFLASVNGEISGNVLLRREQYRWADDKVACVKITRNILTGKLANSKAVLQRALRDHNDKLSDSGMESAVRKLSLSLDALQRTEDLDVLRGIEGESATYYFGVFNDLIVSQKKDFQFYERNRRPPLDNVNCLLSFVYTLLMHDVCAALESVGLDSCVGFLHRDRPGRHSLALDIMEEFRSFLADRLVLSLINREQVNGKGFVKSKSGAVLMNDETRRTVLVAYQKRKQEEIEHPYLKETVQIGLLFYVQALLLSRYLRGDLDGYPVFIWK